MITLREAIFRAKGIELALGIFRRRQDFAMIPIIQKSPENRIITPNMQDYFEEKKNFSWEKARLELDGLPGGKGINIAFEAVDRHASGPLKNKIALRWISKSGQVQDYTYERLSSVSNQFANILAGLGIQKGDRVFALAGRIPELYIAALGTFKNRSVFCPLFSAFGPEPLHARIQIGQAKVLITTGALYKRKVAAIRNALTSLEHVILISDSPSIPEIQGTLNFQKLMQESSDQFAILPTEPEDPALLHFTSGTTGTPKGAIHVHDAVVSHHITGKLALDLHPQDIFWCTADPGWVTGTSYGIIAPLTNGVTSIIDEADFDAERWYGIVQNQRVSVWYTAPTAIRMMMKMGSDLARKYDYSALRFIASVGEPLNPEAVVWGQEAFGMPIHDNWWQTETGGIMISNFPCMEIRPGSMGRPLPGIDATIVRKKETGEVEEINLVYRENWHCALVGLPCFVAIGTNRNGIGNVSRVDITSRAILQKRMPMDISGSWAVRMM